ncbi:MAG: hypothetical protein EBS01_15700, partial [Verrucomicrobia bacterium]|nr:hypothetical protein [Verrucomicrobiota bacterium]
AVTGNIGIGNRTSYGDVSGAVGFSNVLNYEGTCSIYSSKSISFSNIVGGSSHPDALTLGSSGSTTSDGTVSFSSLASLSLDSSVAFIVERATNVAFGTTVSAGSVTIGSAGLVSGDITFSGALTVNSLYLKSTGAEAVASFGNTVRIGAGGAMIVVNNFDPGNGSTQIKATSASATLTIKPYDTTRAIYIGNNSGYSGTALNIDSSAVSVIKTGTTAGVTFAEVNFGDAQAGSGAVVLGNVGSMLDANGARFLNPTHIYGGAITVIQDLDVTAGAGLLHLVATGLGASSGAITVNGVINGSSLSNTTFSDRNATLLFQAAGAININRAVYAADRISLVAGTSGTGTITVDGVTNSGLLATISTAGVATYSRRIELVAGETSGAIVLNGTTLASASTSLLKSNVVLRANGGAITQTDGLI